MIGVLGLPLPPKVAGREDGDLGGELRAARTASGLRMLRCCKWAADKWAGSHADAGYFQEMSDRRGSQCAICYSQLNASVA